MKREILDLICDICDNRIVLKNQNIDLFETGLLDSMTFIELLTEVEEQFEIEFELSEIRKEFLSTPNEIIKFIELKVKQGGK